MILTRMRILTLTLIKFSFSFFVVLVSIWVLGILLRELLVDYGNTPDNVYSQGVQELNTSPGAC